MPKRAQYLRVLVAELQRIASHCLWLGTWCMDMGGALGGGATIFLYCIRERELVLDLFEALVGARLLYGFHQVGGVRYDMPDGWTAQCRADGRPHRAAARRVRGDARGQPVLRDADARASASSRASWREDVGISGPLLRGSGVNFDLRRAQPYSSYEDFEFDVPVETAGDCYARYQVRMVEFRESIRIVRQILDGLPEGPISSRPGVKSVAQVKVPKGEAYARVEGPRGEVGCYLVADGSQQAVPHEVARRVVLEPRGPAAHHSRPQRRRRRRDHGSVDPVFGEVDR